MLRQIGQGGAEQNKLKSWKQSSNYFTNSREAGDSLWNHLFSNSKNLKIIDNFPTEDQVFIL